MRSSIRTMANRMHSHKILSFHTRYAGKSQINIYLWEFVCRMIFAFTPHFVQKLIFNVSISNDWISRQFKRILLKK